MPLHQFYQEHTKISSPDIMLDVRNPDEFASGHVSKAINIPLPELPHRIEELKGFKNIYIYCKRGGRARTAFNFLEQSGLKGLVCIEDAGMDVWKESGYPLEY